MEAVRRWNARRRSPSARAIRDAGPPTVWLVIGAVLSLCVIALLFVAGIHDLAVLAVVPFLAFVVVGRLDRDGWRIRMAVTELAIRQRQRWTWGKLPIDALAAEAWLAAHQDAPPEIRSSVLVTAGRRDEARGLLDLATADTDVDAVRLARLRIVFAAEDLEDHSIADAMTTFDRTPELGLLSAGEQRYQWLSLVWSFAWLRIRSGEPWRDEFAAAVRPLAPFRVPMRYRLFHVVQQYALAIAYLVALAATAALTALAW